MDLTEVLEGGDVDGAIAAVSQRVKQRPSDAGARYLLAELHCVRGDWPRADQHLDTIYRQQEKLIPQVTIFRQLLRAAKARQECFEEGRLPEFQDPPGPVLQLHLRALIALRDGDRREARELLDQAEQSRPRVRGSVDGAEFDDLRDLDDVTSSYVEVMTATGEYFWFPFESLAGMEFEPPQRLRDLLWRPARVLGTDGPVGNVYLPCLYPGSSAHEDPRVRLGRLTDWTGGDQEPVRGVGLRMWLFGEQDRSILQVQRVSIESRSS